MSWGKTKIIADGFELIESGFFQALPKGEISLVIGPVSDPITIKLSFVDEKGKDSSIKSKIIDKKTISIVLHNYSDAFGTGSTVPMKIGTMSGKEVFISLYIEPTAEAKFISYAIYHQGGADG